MCGAHVGQPPFLSMWPDMKNSSVKWICLAFMLEWVRKFTPNGYVGTCLEGHGLHMAPVGHEG